MTTRAKGWLHDPRSDADPMGLRGKLAAAPVDDIAPITTASYMYEHIRRGIMQGALNSCAGVSLVHVIELARALLGMPDLRLSALAAYWDMRALAQLEGYDGGAYMADGITVATEMGIGRETSWPYDPDRVLDRPGAATDIEGLSITGLVMQRVVELDPDRRAEAVVRHLSAGRLVWVGGQITQAYEDLSGKGVLAPPKPREPRLGGHARVYVGHQLHVGGTYSLKELGSWTHWGTGEMPGVCLGNVAVEWVAECPEIVVLQEVRHAA